MLSFLISGVALLLALIGTAALARPLQHGTDDGPLRVCWETLPQSRLGGYESNRTHANG
jgi:hypothetical protein